MIEQDAGALARPAKWCIKRKIMSKKSTDRTMTRRDALRSAVVFSSSVWAAGRFGPARAAAPQTRFADEGLHLLAVGDYGTKGDPSQVAVAKQMGKFAGSLGAPLAAVLALGDNFYRKLTPQRFEDHFEKMYSDSDLNCPFYACVGNHDYGTAKYDFQEGKLQMQLDYARNNPQSRWKLPAKWYAVELPNPEAPLVKIIVLDGSYWPGALKPKEKVAQERFLKTELEKGTEAPWTWVVNHYPLFSESLAHGDDRTLIKRWGKLMQDYPVSLFIAGHDHTLQHLQVEGYQPSFIVSGAGGARLYDIRPSERGFSNNRTLGFNHFHVTRDRLDVQFINAEGEQIHAFNRTPDGTVEVTAKA
jgi:tartrate-resistant acid phosphatase type 5